MKRENTLLQREGDFLLGLAHPGEDAALHIRPGGEYAPQFATADQIEGSAEIREVTQDREGRVRLHGVADLHVDTVQTLGQPRIVIRNRRGTIDIGGRAIEPGDFGQIDRFAMQTLTDITEMMHGRVGPNKNGVKGYNGARFTLKKPTKI